MNNILQSNGLSACLIVKNEEKNLYECLKSIENVADEIVIVDTGSSDSTKEIASKFTSKIYDFDWIDDFSAARNFSLNKATMPLILFIDADERLLNPKQLINIKQNNKQTTGGWLVNLTSDSDKENGIKDIFNTSLLRIVRNNPKIRFKGVIHEQILDSVLNLGLKIEPSDINFYHKGYNLSPDEMREKQLRNLKLLNDTIKNNPSDFYSLHHFGKTKLALGHKSEALKILENVINNCNKDSAIYVQSLNFASVAAYQLGNLEKSKILAEQSLLKIKNQAFANYILGEIANKNQRWDDSLNYYKAMKTAIENPELNAQIVGDYQIPDEELEFRFGRALVALKRHDEAEKHFLRAIEINPKISNSIIGLANINFNKGNLIAAKKLLIEAYELGQNQEQIKGFLNEIDKAEKKQQAIQINSVSDIISKVGIRKTINKDPNEKPLITLSMIVKNEEKMLPECLNSVKELVDEIVIVDTGSNDRTKEIAKQFKAKIFDFPWIDDFSAARNEALKHSNGEWILYLDADERIKKTDFKRLRQMLKEADPNLGGIVCTLESDHSALDGSSELHRGGYPRLFRNLGFPKIRFIGRVHEQISPAIQEAGLGMVKSDIVIIHEGYNRPREEMEQKLKRNYKLLLQHVNEEPTNGYAWYQLGQTLGQMNLKQQSEEAIKFAIRCGNLSNSVFASASATLSQFAGQQKKYNEALSWAEKSLEKAPNQVYGLNLKAHALLFLGRKKQALEIFKKSLELLDKSAGVPQSGFDIMIDRKIILNGIKKAES